MNREPVLTRAGITTVITILISLLIKAGAGDVGDWLTANEDWIAGAVLANGTLVSGWLARGKVTPTSDPKSGAGQKLVPTGSEPAVSAAMTAARAAHAATMPAGTATVTVTTADPNLEKK